MGSVAKERAVIRHYSSKRFGFPLYIIISLMLRIDSYQTQFRNEPTRRSVKTRTTKRSNYKDTLTTPKKKTIMVEESPPIDGRNLILLYN
jgi:hypothetical protein